MRDGEELYSIAQVKNKILMVGHVLEYHPAIIKLKELVSNGELGNIKYIVLVVGVSIEITDSQYLRFEFLLSLCFPK